MPYISTETVRERRTLIRKSFPEWKISVRIDNYSSIDVSIKEGPLPFPTSEHSRDGYEQVNPYYIDEHYEDFPKWKKFLNEIMAIAGKGKKTESYDGDYGNIPNFYVHINIGSWDKEYVQRNKK